MYVNRVVSLYRRTLRTQVLNTNNLVFIVSFTDSFGELTEHGSYGWLVPLVSGEAPTKSSSGGVGAGEYPWKLVAAAGMELVHTHSSCWWCWQWGWRCWGDTCPTVPLLPVTYGGSWTLEYPLRYHRTRHRPEQDGSTEPGTVAVLPQVCCCIRHTKCVCCCRFLAVLVMTGRSVDHLYSHR